MEPLSAEAQLPLSFLDSMQQRYEAIRPLLKPGHDILSTSAEIPDCIPRQ